MALQCSVRHDSGKSWLNPSRAWARGTELLKCVRVFPQALRLRELPGSLALVRPCTPGVTRGTNAPVCIAIRTDERRLGWLCLLLDRCPVATASQARRGDNQREDTTHHPEISLLFGRQALVAENRIHGWPR